MISSRRVEAELKGTARTFIRGKVGLYTSVLFPLVLLFLFGSIFGSSDSAYVRSLIPGLVGFSMLSPMFSHADVAANYKRDKIFKQLALTPLTRAEWLLARILWYITITVPALILVALVGWCVFGVQVSLSIGLVPFLIIGPFLFVSLGMLVATAMDVESQGLLINLVTFPMMFLSGTFYPVSMMPNWLQSIAHIFPLYYLIDGLTSVMTAGDSTGGLGDLAATFVIAVVVFVLAIRLFRWREE
ncbi:MAG TPA: ABC transporter permease [Nitrososphaerales archaeon]|nr:ABC transporter permease [Nitrososphaerales archaeon]